MKISVIGAGYVGVVVGVCFAKLGNEVTLIDIDEERIKALNNKSSPVYEEGLDELLDSVYVKVSFDFQKIIPRDRICT